jgi:hypothetical protein
MFKLHHKDSGFNSCGDEMPLKEWISERANELGISFGKMHKNLYRNNMLPKMRRKNKRVLLVELPVTRLDKPLNLHPDN